MRMGRLYWKFFIFFFLAQLTAVSGVGLAVWISNNKQENANAQIEASPPARSLVASAAATLKFGGVDGLKELMQYWSSRPMPQVYAVDEQGQEIQGRKVSPELVKSANEVLNSRLTGDERPNSLVRGAVQLIKANDGRTYLLFVPAFQKDISNPKMLGFNARARNRHLFPVMPLLAGVLASLIFAAILAWYFSKPIKQLRQAFDSAAKGSLDVRIGNSMGERHDELADLGNAFDQMASRLGALMQSQTRLLHQVSHELRSPLARLQMAVGLARQQPDKLESSLVRIERESARMDSLVGELLELSRLESGGMQLEKEPVNLDELLLSIVEDARFEGMAKQITIQYQAHPGAVNILGQQDLLHRAIDNVIRNALKFSPPQSVIDLRSEFKDHKAIIQVSDQGPGVPEAEIDNVFQPFFRGSASQNIDGHGIGLAIAKQIVEAHGGHIAAHNLPNKGLLVAITLPIVQAD
jgi:two-component system, OmpR family, sensor kinase